MYYPILLLMKTVCNLFVFLMLTPLMALPSASAQTGDIRLSPDGNQAPIIHAIRLPEGDLISVDGFLNEEIWQRAPAATGFTQRIPEDGKPATERTEVRIIYTDTDIYVGFMAYDSAPDSILAPLFRRDGNQPSDWVYISIDSYNDNRTAFTFAVNPRGVQKDILYHDDTNESILWDAVWETQSQILENGWSAEIRIPVSQLRFNRSNSELNWGVNFQRRIARKGEISYWSPTPQTESRAVSLFGELRGIRDLHEPRRLEIMPYAAGTLLREPNPGTGNPYYNRNQLSGNMGGDLRYGLTSNFTLTATINPDFGQVEADPSVINLTARESFFSERRPFFLEGSDIFRFGNTRTFNTYGTPMVFYSRRIGRSPQGSPRRAGKDAEFTNQPDQTTIAGAVKLTGKTKSGWSVGTLNAITLQENALYRLYDGTENEIAVEPATNYFVSRVRKDFNSGNTIIGGFMSAVNRSVNNTYFEDFLRSSAYLGGLDFEHNFMNRNWVVSGTFSYSVINGTEQAIERAQRSQVRYYNRVDSGKLSMNHDKTSLSGTATELSLFKQGGDTNWLGSLTFSQVSPGYEVNDVGFQNRSDYRALTGGVVYRETNPVQVQNYDVFLFYSNARNYDGDTINNGFGTGGSVRFNNLWSARFSSNYNFRQYNDRQTRSGPVIREPANFSTDYNVSTNPNLTFSYFAGNYNMWNEEGGYTYSFWTGVRARPIAWLQVSLDPTLIFRNSMSQYIATVNDDSAVETYGRRYVFSELEQVSLYINFRLDWTFSTNMSLQTYIRPFISSGRFSGFKELAAARSFRFNRYGEDTGTITEINGEYTVDPDGTGMSVFSFSNPDFNFRSIQGNAVFRWEYRPGSTLFLVWQQQREDAAGVGNFDPSRDFSNLFRAKATNVFLVKLSYWFGS